MRKSSETWLFTFLLIVVLPLLAYSAYSNTFCSPLVLDDTHSFVDEPKVYIPSYNKDSLIRLSETKFGIKRYLPMLSFSVDHWRGRGHLSTYHVTNLLIHLLVFLALIFMLKMIFRTPRAVWGEISGFENYLIFFAAALWLLSPLQTNAVTYVVQRMTSLMTFFFMLSLACYLVARIEITKARPLRLKTASFFLFSFISAICSFISKENSAMLPVVILATEFFLFDPSTLKSWLCKKRVLLFLVPLFFIACIFCFTVILPHILDGYSIRRFTLSERLMTELRVVVLYASLLLLPLPSRLNLEHDVQLSTSLFSPITTLFSFLLILASLVTIWRLPRKYNLFRFGLFWFLINLVIESSFVPLEMMFEHRLYLPSVGFYLVCSILIFVLLRCCLSRISRENFKKIFLATSLLVAATFTLMTYQRNNAWSSAVSIYQDCVNKAPLKARNYAGLSKAYSVEKKYLQALKAAEKAIALSRDHYEEYWSASCNLLAAEMQVNGYESAVNRGEQLIADAPKITKKNAYPFFLTNLAIAYFKNGQYAKASSVMKDSLSYFLLMKDVSSIKSTSGRIMLSFKKELESDGEYENKKVQELVFVKMVDLFFSLRDNDKALLYCKAGLENFPESGDLIARREKIITLDLANQIQKKRGTLEENYFKQPFASRSHFFMAVIYAIQKYNLPFDWMLGPCFDQVEKLGDFQVDRFLMESWYYHKHGQPERALDLIHKALSLDPDYAQLWVNQGMYELALGNGESSIKSFNKALALYPGYPQKNMVKEMIKMAYKKNEAVGQ